MVTSYYLHMISSANNRPKTPAATPTKFDIDGYYRSILDIAPRSSGKSLCRICLREGSIPIHSNRDIAEALAAFANVKISESKDYPKHLCEVCHKFLKGAIVFRKRAKLTNKILKKSISSSTTTSPVKKEKVKVKVKIERIENDDYGGYSPGAQNDDDSHSDTNNGPSLPKNKHIKNKNIKIKNQPPPRVRLPKKDYNNARKTCKICNKSFNRKYIQTHMTLHNPDHINEHVCEVCGKSFRIAGNLYSHQQIHHKPKKPETLSNFKFKCDHCPYRARQRKRLTAHMVIHSGNKEHMCTECPAKFYYVCNLRKHMLTHKEPQVQCDSCDKMFHTEAIMKKHYEAEHLGILKHVCHICGKAFGYRKPLSKHLRFVHKTARLDFKAVPAYVRVQMENPQASEHTEPIPEAF